MTKGASGVFGLASLLMALVFLSFAAVQYNDPDPERWMAMYGSAAVVSDLAAFRPSRAWLPAAAVALVALAWAVSLFPGVFGHSVAWGEVFTATYMINSDVEETRETLGLVIVAVWQCGSVDRRDRRPRGWRGRRVA